MLMLVIFCLNGVKEAAGMLDSNFHSLFMPLSGCFIFCRILEYMLHLQCKQTRQPSVALFMASWTFAEHWDSLNVLCINFVLF